MADTDQTSRDRIRNDIHSNFFVEAGAGSGKTSVLVDRMVAMVEGGIDISKISAITFTKAAAGEFYSRFQQKLAESSSPLAQKALNDIDLCFMGTIDAFCNMVLSEHPMAANIPSNAVVVEDSEMEALYIREYSKILQGSVGTPELHEKAVRFAGSFYNAKDVFVQGMKMMAANKNTEFNYVKPIQTTVDKYFGEKKKRLIEILRFLCEHEEIMQLKSSKPRKAYESLLDNIKIIEGSWDENIDTIDKKLKELNGLRIIPEYLINMGNIGRDWDSYFVEHYNKTKTAWIEVNVDEDAMLDKSIQNIKFQIAMDFIHDCVDIVSDTLRAEGKLSFSDYLIYLRDVLRKDAAGEGKLIKHIYDRHSYFLIDEFQDTNPIQAEIFFYLTAEEANENWKECKPRPGSLFIVGDPKQSIYRFRNADVASFLKVREMFEDPSVGEVLYLTRNFRSTDVVCAWFNKIFNTFLSKNTENQSKFNEIPTGEKKPNEGTLEGIYKYDIPFERSYKNNLDPHTVAKIILTIVNDPSITIQIVQTGEIRRPEYKDFMLITPGKSHMEYYMNKFARYGIPFKVEGKVLFSECEALRSISYILNAVADPFNAKYKYAALHLSGCKLSEDKLQDYAKKSQFMSPAAVFSMILDEERVLARVGADNAEYVYYALELLRSATSDGTVGSIKEAADYISELINGNSGEERCLQLRSDANRVHIANLHKVKGLEAPIVILADANRNTQDPEMRVEYSSNPPQSYIFQFNNSLKSKNYASKKEAEAEVLEEEKIRLLYVAATRASNVLIMENYYTSSGIASSRSMWDRFINSSTEDIFDRLGECGTPNFDFGEGQDAETLYDKADDESVLNNKAVCNKSFNIKRPSTITLKGVTSAEDDYEDKAETIKVERTNEQALLLGTMVHKIMESLVSSGNAYDEEALVLETLNEYEAEKEYFEPLLKSVVKTIRNGGYAQNNGAPQDILNELLEADEVHCELPFCFKENETDLWHGIMDVVYKKDGKWHIVDYKTNVDASDLDEHYQEQLNSYIKAFKEMTGEDADALIYHIAV